VDHPGAENHKVRLTCLSKALRQDALAHSRSEKGVGNNSIEMRPHTVRNILLIIFRNLLCRGEKSTVL